MKWGQRWIEVLRHCVGEDYLGYERAVEEINWLRSELHDIGVRE